ncbi:Zn-dependent protease (includes SpoIVFB) [Dehalogenimonas formicexedens]|uniref:Zinc metalloprotease n=1 Tax=Dehalogenimonas formicexedens TaxID=1839801 RepID=A0A1P8F763_9CHLR|nr:site-2 protease family protein [Dehalogenimonas formicexedens]APV44319.1 Zn-dependent protease (includes SpoIVFB) [Dehalogenimonas formicexedens]
MRSSFRLGRILGIEVRIHVSWLLIFAFLTWSLAAGYFPSLLPDGSTAEYWLLGAVSSIALFASVLAHEIGHSIVARRNGIPVKDITLFIFGGASNITREAESAGAEFRMAVTGPVVSFILGGIFLAIYFAAGGSGTKTAFNAVMVYLGQINLILGAFNLVPGFPLDGGRVFRSIVWTINHDAMKATRIAATTGQIIAYIFIFGGIALAFTLSISGLWLAFVGWFLASAASASLQQSVLLDTLKGVKVREIAKPEIKTGQPNLTIEQALSIMLDSRQRALPVMEDGRMSGLVSMTDIKRSSRENWPVETIDRIMTPAASVKTVAPDDDLTRALELLQSEGFNQLPVISGGQLRGLISRSDLLNYIQLKQEASR